MENNILVPSFFELFLLAFFLLSIILSIVALILLIKEDKMLKGGIRTLTRVILIIFFPIIGSIISISLKKPESDKKEYSQTEN